VTGAEAWRAVCVAGTAVPCSGDEVLAGAASPPVSGIALAAGITTEVLRAALTSRTAGAADETALAGTTTEGVFTAGASPPDTLIVTGAVFAAGAAAGTAIALAGGTAADPVVEGFSPSQSFCDSKSVRGNTRGHGVRRNLSIRNNEHTRMVLPHKPIAQIRHNICRSFHTCEGQQRSQRTCEREHLRPAGAGGLNFILGFSLLALLVTVRDARITGVIVARRVVLVATAAVTVAVVAVITVKYRRTLRQARSRQPKNKQLTRW
jgi:hypothetical protein